MLFIIEGIDLAGVFYSDFQGIQINFAPPRPARFANFCGAGQDLLFCGAGRGGAALFPRGGAGRGGAHIPAFYEWKMREHPLEFKTAS